MFKKIFSIIFILSLISVTTYASEPTTKDQQQNVDTSTDADFEKIITEYREYASSIASELRDEVIEFRKSMASLNKQKRELYQKLSQAAQGYLAKEQEYRKKLPIKYKKHVGLEQTNTSHSKPKDNTK